MMVTFRGISILYIYFKICILPNVSYCTQIVLAVICNGFGMLYLIYI